MDENLEKCQKEVINDFIKRHWTKICIIIVVLRLLADLSSDYSEYKKRTHANVAVTIECSTTEDGEYNGETFYLEDRQPMMGLTKNGEIYRSFPIEREEYDSIMKINYRIYAGENAEDDQTAYYKVTVTDNKGKNIFSDAYIYPLVSKSFCLRSKYVDEAKV